MRNGNSTSNAIVAIVAIAAIVGLAWYAMQYMAQDAPVDTDNGDVIELDIGDPSGEAVDAE